MWIHTHTYFMCVYSIFAYDIRLILKLHEKFIDKINKIKQINKYDYMIYMYVK